jgi:hypothetical protein
MDDLYKVLEEIAKIIAGGMGWELIKNTYQHSGKMYVPL